MVEQQIDVFYDAPMKLRYALLLLVIPLLAVGGIRLWYHLTDGFLVANITYSLPFDLRRETRPPDPNLKQQIAAILDQDFYYLGKGNQSYVFESSDGDYVIKFFKYQRYKPSSLMATLRMIPWFKNRYYERYDQKRAQLDSIFNACQMAYEQLPHQTGLVYAKLDGATVPWRSITIHDKLGIRHEISLDGMQFLIQRKAQLFCENVKTLVSCGKQREAEDLALGVINLIMDEHRQGGLNASHPQLEQLGVLEGEPLGLSQAGCREVKGFRKELIEEKCHQFITWLDGVEPSLSKKMDHYVHELLERDIF